jgi:hypothetical protein
MLYPVCFASSETCFRSVINIAFAFREGRKAREGRKHDENTRRTVGEGRWEKDGGGREVEGYEGYKGYEKRGKIEDLVEEKEERKEQRLKKKRREY